MSRIARLPFWVVLFAGIAPAQDAEWTNAVVRAQRAEDTGDYPEALTQYRQASAVASKFPASDPRTWGTYNALAIAYEENGLLAEAIHTVQRSMEMIRKALGTETLSYALGLANLGAIQLIDGDLAAAEAHLRQAIRAEARLPDTTPVQLAKTKARLAEALLARGHSNEAEPLVVSALPALRDSTDANDPSVALNDLSLIRRAQHRYSEGLEMIQEAVRLTEKGFGPNHPLLLRPLNNLAVLYMDNHRLEEAEATFKRAESIWQQLLPNHPAHAQALRNYAVLLRQMGDKSRAKAIKQQASALDRDSALRNGNGLTVDVSAFRPH